LYPFVENYNFTVEKSLLGNRKCFASWLNHYWKRIEAACYNEEISVKTFKEGVLKMIEPAMAWPGRDAFICDVYGYKTKPQILERCETAIKNARKIRNT
jgi:hypothetical protein